MKQGKIIRAYKALEKLMQQDTPLPIAMRVFDLHEILRPSWEFQIIQEQKLQDKYKSVDFSTFSVSFKTDDENDKKLKLAELSACEKEIKDLAEMDRDVVIEVIEIPINMVSVKMAGSDIEALKGFVEFIA